MHCFFPAAEPTDVVHQLHVKYRIETLTLSVVTRLAGSGKALSEAQSPEMLPYRCTGVLVVPVRVEDAPLAGRQLLVAERIV